MLCNLHQLFKLQRLLPVMQLMLQASLVGVLLGKLLPIKAVIQVKRLGSLVTKLLTKLNLIQPTHLSSLELPTSTGVLTCY